jgi:hypothetical protein
MCKANLLVHIESFAWSDLTISRTNELDGLALVIPEIKKKEDVIFSHPDTYLIKLPWGNLYEILTFDEVAKQKYCQWLSHDQQKTLIKLFSHSVTKRPSYNINHLDEEFKGAANGMLGIDITITQKYVYDISTLGALHALYKKLGAEILLPSLTISGNEINSFIERKQTHPIFRRLDQPKQIEEGKMLHGEQIQMHFNDKDKSCLNIDGTWKHGSFDIPREAKDILKEWGFLLPTEMNISSKDI